LAVASKATTKTVVAHFKFTAKFARAQAGLFIFFGEGIDREINITVEFACGYNILGVYIYDLYLYTLKSFFHTALQKMISWLNYSNNPCKSQVICKSLLKKIYICCKIN
jgi:hypothetical protein